MNEQQLRELLTKRRASGKVYEAFLDVLSSMEAQAAAALVPDKLVPLFLEWLPTKRPPTGEPWFTLSDSLGPEPYIETEKYYDPDAIMAFRWALEHRSQGIQKG